MIRELRPPLARYDDDVHRWSHEQARLMRDGHFDLLDRANIAEDLATLGRSEAAALRSSLHLIVLHLLNSPISPNVPAAPGPARSCASATISSVA